MPKRRERIHKVLTEAQTIALESMKAQGRVTDTIELAVAAPENISAEISRHQIVIALVHLIHNAFESFEMIQDKNESNGWKSRPEGNTT